MEKRNATAAVIGAGDFIGAEIAKRFAAEGFTVFAGRRNGDKLQPMVQQIEQAGGTVFGRSLDARKEDEVVKFLSDADKNAPLEVCIFNVGANVNFPILETTERIGGELIEIRRAHLAASVGAHGPRAVVVGHEHDDVGLARGCASWD